MTEGVCMCSFSLPSVGMNGFVCKGEPPLQQQTAAKVSYMNKLSLGAYFDLFSIGRSQSNEAVYERVPLLCCFFYSYFKLIKWQALN